MLAPFFLQNSCQNESANSYEKSMNFGSILASILAPFWYPKCIEHRIKNIIDFGIDFGTILAPKMAPKMEPKWVPMKFEDCRFYFQSHLATMAAFLDRFWKPVGLPATTFFAILINSGRPDAPEPPKIESNANRNEDPPRTRCKYAENLPRTAKTRRDPLRTFQGPAVRTPSTNISHNATAKKRLRSATNDRE